MFHGCHLLKQWSKAQAVVATSSAEAELYAGSKCSSEALGIQQYMCDLGKKCKVEVHMDSSAALSLTQRTGLGKAKHIDVQHLWLQDLAREGRVTYKKVPGDQNPSDLMTKGLSHERICLLMRLLGFEYAGC